MQYHGIFFNFTIIDTNCAVREGIITLTKTGAHRHKANKGKVENLGQIITCQCEVLR